MPTIFPFAFWLTPERQAYTQLESHIQTICQQYKVDSFPPHVTLFVGEYQQNEDMVGLVRQLADAVSPIAMKLEKIDHSDFLFKTLFLQFAPHPSPVKLVQIIQNSLQNYGDYQFDPHLSLVYAKIPSTIRQSLAQSIQLDRDSILFNRLDLVIPNPETNAWADIAGWKMQQTWSLS